MKRTATAVWNGSLKEGKGNLTTQSKTLENTAYSFHSRFEEGTGTNPEELIAAAHAGCFAMALSNELGKAGYTPDALEATAVVTLDSNDLKITSSQLTLKAKIPNIDADKFQELAEGAKANCPVSKVLNLDISLDASLTS